MPKLDWVAVLDEVEVNTSRGAFMAWFKKTELLEVVDGEATVLVASVFAKKQLTGKIPEQLLPVIQKHDPSIKSIRYVVSRKQVKKQLEPSISLVDNGVQSTPAMNAKPRSTKKPQGLNERYTFDTFVVGSSNELAFAAAESVVNNPGTRYNPLFIYGGVGLGKTHLIQAIGNEIAVKNPEKNIIYVSTEHFVSEFIKAIRSNRGVFTDEYRKADVLIVDDMQFITGKEKTQEEFFHTFNELHQSNKQIIISSDKPPKSIPTLTDRLRSRFEWGMAIDIQLPDFETRSAIISSKARDIKLPIDDEAVEYIALNVRSNIRELEGSINQIAAYCEMRRISPTVDIVRGLIESGATSPKRITAKSIIDKTCRFYDLEKDDLMSPKRDKSIALPRQVAMYLIRSELKLSFPRIAKEVGRKDHTTAIHSVNKISKAVSLDQQLRSEVNSIKESLYA